MSRVTSKEVWKTVETLQIRWLIDTKDNLVRADQLVDLLDSSISCFVCNKWYLTANRGQQPQLSKTFPVSPVQKPVFILNPSYVLSTSDFLKSLSHVKKPAAVKTLRRTYRLQV